MSDITNELLKALLTATDEAKSAALKALKGDTSRHARTPAAAASGDGTTAMQPNRGASSSLPSSRRRKVAQAVTPETLDATPDVPGDRPTDPIAQLAEIFVEDMLRLEREHGLNAEQMLQYYKGELELKKPEVEGGVKRRA